MKPITELLLFRIISILLLAVLVQSEFSPDVRWSCSPTSLSVFVRTDKPFDGIIAPKGVTHDDCVVHGIGTNLAVYRLELNQTECGVRYDQDSDVYSVSLDIHSHPILIVDEDKTMNLTCRGRRNASVETASDEPSLYRLQLLDDIIPTKTARYAAPYNLRVDAIEPNAKFRIGKCTASGGQNASVELSDGRGCSLFSSLLSDFHPAENAMIARIPSMFRFPGTRLVTIECQIVPCDGECEDVDCMKEDSAAPALLERTTSMVENEYEKVSLTVTLEEKHENMEEESLTPPIPSTTVVPLPLANDENVGDCARTSDLELMYALCTLLSALTAIGFSLNVLFCCLLWRRREGKSAANGSGPRPFNAAGHGDFWIMDSNKAASHEQNYFDGRRNSGTSYASVKNKPRRVAPPSVEYGMPASRSSDGSSTYGADIYRRPDIRHSSSTFMAPSTTMETDLDSSVSSNQASSYH